MPAPTSEPESVLNSPPPVMITSGGKKTLETFDTISKFCIGLAGLVLSGTIGFSTIYYSHQATERQANAQIELLAQQRRSSAAQVETSLLPVFMNGKDAERRLALSILASLAPDEAERLGALVIPQLQSADARREATQLISSVPEKKRQEKLRHGLQVAAVYRQFSLDASACREYFDVIESLTAAEKRGVDAEVEQARQEYARGQFRDAADRLQAILGKR